MMKCKLSGTSVPWLAEMGELGRTRAPSHSAGTLALGKSTCQPGALNGHVAVKEMGSAGWMVSQVAILTLILSQM